MASSNKRDAERYRWIKRNCTLELGSYTSAGGWLDTATESFWSLQTRSLLRGVKQPPKDVSRAIDAAIKRERAGKKKRR